MPGQTRHPYENRPAHHYWRSGVSVLHPVDLQNLYAKKFEISTEDRIMTAGSCFAQHVARFLRNNGFSVLDEEPPLVGTAPETAKEYGYQLYSARYGNIYTPRQLLQLIEDSAELTLRDEDVWEKKGRYYDALRPNIEPKGLASRAEVQELRRSHLRAVRRLLEKADVLVFTLGLTESWINRETGTVYPTCPGVIAGSYDESVYAFKNFDYNEILDDLRQVIRSMRRSKDNMRFLFTVSPVPLTATASDHHVMVATSYSKSVLRAVCGHLADNNALIDYFPSYEIVTAPHSRGYYFDPNMRTVNDAGVNTVMQFFMAEHMPKNGAAAAEAPQRGRNGKAREVESQDAKSDLVCEEELLKAFAP